MKIVDRKFLPKITNSVHASTIEFWRDHFVFSWFGGTKEGDSDVCIYIYNLNNDNKIIKIGDKDNIPRWNPILYKHKDRLFLFEKVGFFCDRWQTFINDITNLNEKTLHKEIVQKRQILPAGLNGPVKTRPIEFNDSIFCGSSVETILDWTSYIEEYTIEDYNWIYKSRSNPIYPDKVVFKDIYTGTHKMSQGIIQPSLWIDKMNNGDMVLKSLFRSSGHERVFYSEMSGDNSWEKPIATNIVNPNSSVYALKTNNELYLTYNNHNYARSPLVLSKLKQNNKCDFEIENNCSILIANDPSSFAGFSYPYMIEHDGYIHLVYTHERTNIEYCIIEP